MDLFAGSEPRKIISFRLDKEKNGQPSQSGRIDAEELSIQDTTPQITRTSAESIEPDNGLPTSNLPEAVSIPQRNLEIASGSNEPDQRSSDCSGVLVADYQREENVEGRLLAEVQQELLSGLTGTSQCLPTTSITAQQSNEPNKETMLQESSSSQENCQAYFTRRME